MAAVVIAALCLSFVAVTGGTPCLPVTVSDTSAGKPQSLPEVRQALFSLAGLLNCPACCSPRGLSVVPDEEVIDMYEGSHVPLEQMSDFYGKVMRNALFM